MHHLRHLARRDVRTPQTVPSRRVVPIREVQVLVVDPPTDLRVPRLGRHARQLDRHHLLREPPREARRLARVRPPARVLERRYILQDLYEGYMT